MTSKIIRGHQMLDDYLAHLKHRDCRSALVVTYGLPDPKQGNEIVKSIVEVMNTLPAAVIVVGYNKFVSFKKEYKWWSSHYRRIQWHQEYGQHSKFFYTVVGRSHYSYVGSQNLIEPTSDNIAVQVVGDEALATAKQFLDVTKPMYKLCPSLKTT